MTHRHLRIGVFAILLAASLGQFGGAAYIHVKAVLAQTLLRDAWAATLHGQNQVPPWPWADTWPVARLRAPQHDQDLVVLAGASGRTLAFGPGQLSGTPAPGQPGRTVIAGHRDTHFAFLRDIRPGDELQLQGADGTTHRFQVSGTRVADSRSEQLALDAATELVLVTCYPFDAVDAGGPLRLLVFAAPYGEHRTSQQNSPQFDYRASQFIPRRARFEAFNETTQGGCLACV